MQKLIYSYNPSHKMGIDLILQNTELMTILYAFFIAFICAILVLKIDRMFKISDYQGLRYIRNAFFFYSLSFIILFVLGRGEVNASLIYTKVIWFLFKFLITTAVLFLLYSLIWKKVEKNKSHNSLFNLKSATIYLIALVLSITGTHIFYPSQIILNIAILSFSLKNLINEKNKYPFLKYYSIAICASLLHWTTSYLIELGLLNAHTAILSIFGNLAFFLIFLGGILNITRNKNG
jgi:hypothetical protein